MALTLIPDLIHSNSIVTGENDGIDSWGWSKMSRHHCHDVIALFHLLHCYDALYYGRIPDASL